MAEPTRLLPPLIPLPGGAWQATTVLTPEAFKLRGLALMPSNSVIPVMVVPGIMGSNLRAKLRPRLKKEHNEELDPGKPAWRPPNTMPGGLWDALVWDSYKPVRRQHLLDPDTLEVDEDGPPHIPHRDGRLHVHSRLARECGWGELHADSCGELLCALETRLNRTFLHDDESGERSIQRQKESGARAALTPANIRYASFAAHQPGAGRLVKIDPAYSLLFEPEPPDCRGDRTVPAQSGAGPSGKVQHLFRTRGL